MGDVSISIGSGFFSLLTILFIALKLLDKINWSWWWVLGPLWIPLVLGLCILIFFFIMAYLLDAY